MTISEHGGTTISYTGDPEDSVADFEPRDIHGVLEDGTAVSIVGAQGGKKHAGSFYDWKYRQQFRSTRHVLVGEHVEEIDRHTRTVDSRLPARIGGAPPAVRHRPSAAEL